MHRSIPMLQSALALWLCASTATAEPLVREDVPAPLKPWIDWALHGANELTCPSTHQGRGREDHLCSWPTQLTLELDERGGRFEGLWRSFARGFSAIPGDTERWPQGVQVDGRAAPVVAREERPHIELSPGYHRVSGSFRWDTLPEALSVPPSIALLKLSVQGEAVPFVRRDARGRVALERRSQPEREADRLVLRVQRKIVDDVPLVLHTRILMQVSGKQRAVALPRALLPEFIPLALEGPLPARLEPSGTLRVEVRAGQWEMMLVSRRPNPVTSLELPQLPSPWPAEEVWSFEAQPRLRRVELRGPAQIDPQQTSLPDDWKRLPSFRLLPAQKLRLEQQQRGNDDAPADRLTLRRSIWLDFDGRGATIRDAVGGELHRSQRLEMGRGIELGRVAVRRVDQFITRREGSDLRGVEVRERQLALEADSRQNAPPTLLPAVGWNHDFQTVSAQVFLPPGWRLFHASGPDTVQSTWLNSWSLLDLFLLLITALAVSRLYGRLAGGVAFVTLALVFPEAGAPRAAWLVMLALEGVHRALPDGRLRRASAAGRVVAAALLVVLVVPFAVNQLRRAFYPSLQAAGELGDSSGLAGMTLDAPRAALAGPGDDEDTAAKPAAPAELADLAEEGDRPARERAKSGSLATSIRQGLYAQKQEAQAENLLQHDPRASVQTGPGRPDWSWHAAELRWNGPVKRDERMRLYLVPPWLGLGLAWLRVVGLAALLLVALRFGRAWWRCRSRCRSR